MSYLQAEHNISDDEIACDDTSGTSVGGYDGDDDEIETVCEYDAHSKQLICSHNKTITKEWIFVGSTVLSRWSDGLWYLGLIVQIDSISEKCLVQFEDSSLYWTRFEDLHKQLSVDSVMADSDILCAICRDGLSEAPNEIVICDVCNQGYHQKCHKPKIGDEILEPDVAWSCRLCVFALGTKEGGAEKVGIIADALRHFKTVLPYELSDLHWDESHFVNKEGRYCYCGGPGSYYSKMLQCERCLQWFHEACIQALETPLLYGDHYYTFLCAICNKGKEKVKRIIMKWSDVMALVINNLALKHQKKFFDLHSEIVTFVQNNYHMLKLSEDISKLSEDELTLRITSVLKDNKSIFVCGRELRKKSTSYALRLPFPFTTPLIFAPPFSLQSSSSNPTSPSSPPFPANALSFESSNTTANALPLVYGACRKGASKWPASKRTMKKLAAISLKNGRSNSCSSSTGSNSCTASSISSSSRCSSNLKTNKRSLSFNTMRTNCVKAVKEQKSTKRVSKYPPSHMNSDSSDVEMSSTCALESLEAVIPPPKNFEGDNNPFSNVDNNSRLLQSGLQTSQSTDAKQLTTNLMSSQQRISLFKSELSCNASDNAVHPTFQSIHLQHNNFNIIARRIGPNGTVEYLFEWDNK